MILRVRTLCAEETMQHAAHHGDGGIYARWWSVIGVDAVARPACAELGNKTTFSVCWRDSTF